MAKEENELTPLEMAKAIDGMDRSCTNWECDFLESVIIRMNGGFSLTGKQLEKLRQIYEKYFGENADRLTPEEELDL